MRGKGPWSRRGCLLVVWAAAPACSSSGSSVDRSTTPGPSAEAAVDAPDQEAASDAQTAPPDATDSDRGAIAMESGTFSSGDSGVDSGASNADGASPSPDGAAPTLSEAGQPSIVAIGAGSDYACALGADGRVLCWGLDSVGQLGKPSTYTFCQMTCRPWADAVENLSDARSLAVGTSHACALRSDGTVVCWGDNGMGELGVPSAKTQDSQCSGPCSFAPLAVPGISGATAVASGDGFSCAIVAGGAIECWGQTLGGAMNAMSPTPVTVSGISGARAISAGSSHACAILADGTVSCWGDNTNGQLGNGTQTSSSTPVVAAGLKGAQSISAGAQFTCAVLTDGTGRCWGSNSEGQLGDGAPFALPRMDPPQPLQTSPAVVVGLSNARTIFAGLDYTCAVAGAGSLEYWGQGNPIFVPNAVGTVADAGSQAIADPNVTDVVGLAAGTLDVCLLRATGAVHCYGSNEYGSIGNDYEGTTSTGGPDVDVDFSQVQ